MEFEELKNFLESEEGRLALKKATPEYDGQGVKGTNLRGRKRNQLLSEKNFELYLLFKKMEQAVKRQKLLDELAESDI